MYTGLCCANDLINVRVVQPYLPSAARLIVANAVHRLLDRDLPGYITRFLLSWYKNQSMSVKWGETLSAPFSVSNGVCQGGVLSPILFTMYIDDLLVDLSNLGVGCFWGSLFAGALCYADDLVLLAPSPSALRMMLRCCEDFALKRGLRFNASKTQLIRFSSSPSSSCAARFHLCGCELPSLSLSLILGTFCSTTLVMYLMLTLS